MLVGALVLSLLAPSASFAAPGVAAEDGASVVAESITLPAHRWVGFYVPGAPTQIAPLATLESKLRYRAVFSTYYQSTEQGFAGFPASNAIEHGAMPLITLELWDHRGGVAQPAYSLRSITRGDHDAYLRAYAKEAKRFGRIVWLRPFHEMNGFWYPWCGTANGNKPSDFAPAWRHVHDIFAAEGATNVRFVWCPNIESLPDTPGNAISAYWPGEAYVDYMALDGYNFGYGDGIRWRSFEDLFDAPYDELCSLSDRPIFVAETGCATVGGDKAAWITEMFRVVPERFPRIRGIGWFNGTRYRDWRIESDARSLWAFRTALRSSAWSDRATGTTWLDRRRSFGDPPTTTVPPTAAVSGSRARICFDRTSNRASLVDGGSPRPVGR